MTTSLFNRIRPDQIADRLDGEYYAKELLENETKLNHFNQVTLENCVTNIRNAISDLTSNGSFEFLRGIQFNNANGIPYVRTQNLMDGYIDFSDGIYVDLKCKDMVAKSLCETGDLIVCRKGKVGAASAISADMHGAAISENVTRFRLDNSYDADFLATFLNSNHGRMRFLREATGVIQKWINNEKLRQIRVIRIDSSAEKYIGDKVRQAEQLRVWAKRLYRIPAFIDAFIQGALPLSLTDLLFSLIKKSNNDAIKELTKFLALNIEYAQMKQNFQDFIEKNKMGSVDIEREFFHINTVSTSAIEDFLSAQTYRPAITDAFDKITSKKFSTLQSISLEPIRQGATPKFSAIGKKCIKSKQTRDLFLDETGYEIVDPNDEQNKRIVRLKRNDILVTRQGAGTVGRASIFLDDEETYITDSLFLVRIDPAKANPAFVAGFLRSYTGQRLIEKGVYGSTGQLNLSSTALRNIPILDVPLEFQNFLGETLCTADTLFKLSTRLTQSAKTLVEALIEGQLTERQLIQAQQALEDGDNSLDQAILSKLSAEGYAIEGATPLFSDVDELYSLLEEAAQAEAEE